MHPALLEEVLSNLPHRACRKQILCADVMALRAGLHTAKVLHALRLVRSVFAWLVHDPLLLLAHWDVCRRPRACRASRASRASRAACAFSPFACPVRPQSAGLGLELCDWAAPARPQDALPGSARLQTQRVLCACLEPIDGRCRSPAHV